MSTAHEVLSEVKAARLRSDGEDLKNSAQWQKLVARCRSTRHTKLMLLIMSGLTLAWFGFVLVVLFEAPDLYSQFRPFLFPSVCVGFALISAMTLLRQRSDALVDLIQLAAPELYEKLKDEGVL